MITLRAIFELIIHSDVDAVITCNSAYNEHFTVATHEVRTKQYVQLISMKTRERESRLCVR